MSIRAYLGKRGTETILLLILLHAAIAILDTKAFCFLLDRYFEIWIIFLRFLAKVLDEFSVFVSNLIRHIA